MKKSDYSNRELDRMFGEITDTLSRIETQTTKTNGQIASLKMWRAYTTGAITVIVVVVLPVLGYLAMQEIHTGNQVSGLIAK